MTWKYIAVEEDGVWGIKEDYGTHGVTEGFITPSGESLEELIQDLRNMLGDINGESTMG